MQVLYIIWYYFQRKTIIQCRKAGRYTLCLWSYIDKSVGWPRFWNLSEKRKCKHGNPKGSYEFSSEIRNLRIQCLEKDPRFETKAQELDNEPNVFYMWIPSLLRVKKLFFGIFLSLSPQEEALDTNVQNVGKKVWDLRNSRLMFIFFLWLFNLVCIWATYIHIALTNHLHKAKWFNVLQMTHKEIHDFSKDMELLNRKRIIVQDVFWCTANVKYGTFPQQLCYSLVRYCLLNG